MDRSLQRTPLSEIHPKSGIRSMTEDDQQRFTKLVQKAKEHAAEGHIKSALKLNQEAFTIFNSDKLAKRIKKMQDYLAEYNETESDEEGDEMAHVGNNFYLFRDLYNKLYSHQREGVLWLWKLHKARKGGILGDDMGLGKTIQIISFLSGLFDAGQANSVLIVVPVAVIVNWEKEFEKWAPGVRVVAFHGSSKRERERGLDKVHRRGGVVMTSYGMVISSVDVLGNHGAREFVWDYIILDEGHKIKNPSTKGSKSLHRLAARHRIILTGTPVQNNLKEMWALFDWTHQGTLLGTARTFHLEYEQPIIRARQKDATGGEQRLGHEIATSLKKIITPYFLRRTKADVKKGTGENQSSGTGDDNSKAPEMPTFTRKNDLVCWVYLSELQQKIYEAFVQTEEVRNLLNTTKSPLTALVVLKKICDHPRLLTLRQCVELGIDVRDVRANMGDMDEAKAKESAASHIQQIPDDILTKESGKMVFLVELLDNIRSEGHRALVFSQSRKMLDMIQKVITARGHKVARLDGTLRLLAEREEVIKKFTRDKSYSVFLLTTQVGGVGLTLTAADRVVIFDPSWNPATDAQAVDRAFRIGQEKNVVIYRLITCGSIEEKIYRRQIFKDSITKQTTGDSSNPYRYFSRQELHELFVLDNPRLSNTQTQLMEIHSQDKRKTDTGLDAHIAFLHTLEMFGISDHDLMFSQEAHNDEDEDVLINGPDYIHNRVSKAQQAIVMESEENYQMTQQLGKYPGPEAAQAKQRRPREDAFEVPEVPESVFKPNGQPLIDVANLYANPIQDSEQSDSDSDDHINQSMKDLTVDHPPSDEENNTAAEASLARAQMKSTLIIQDDTELVDKGESDMSTDNHPDFRTPPDSLHNSMKRGSDESSNEENSPGTSAKKAKSHTSGHLPTHLGLDPDECDVIDLEPRRPLKPELYLDRGDQGKENSSPARPATPVLRKRRPSVCNPNTPIKKFTAEELRDCLNNLDTAESNIVSEEIVFSPKPMEALVGTTGSGGRDGRVGHSRVNTPPSLNETENYELFAQHVPMNSTVLSVVNKTKLDIPETFQEVAEEEEVETSEPVSHESSHEADNSIPNGTENNDSTEQMEHESASEPNEGVENSPEQEGEMRDEQVEDDAEDDEESSSEEEELTEEEEQRYIELMTKSRKLYKSGVLMEALELALDALEIYSGDDRAQQYARRLRDKLMKQHQA